MNYSNTIIYKIVCKNVEITECYVGHTTNFSQRKTSHSASCHNIGDSNFNRYVYQFIRNNNGWENWDMVEVEKYNALDKLDAHKRERYWIETLGAKLNKAIPTRTRDEYIKIWKEQNKEYNTKYYEEHKKEISEYKKIYSEQNKEQIVEKNKKWYDQNKEQIAEKRKLKYEQNKDKINAQRRLNRALKKEAQA